MCPEYWFPQLGPPTLCVLNTGFLNTVPIPHPTFCVLNTGFLNSVPIPHPTLCVLNTGFLKSVPIPHPTLCVLNTGFFNSVPIPTPCLEYWFPPSPPSSPWLYWHSVVSTHSCQVFMGIMPLLRFPRLYCFMISHPETSPMPCSLFNVDFPVSSRKSQVFEDFCA